MTAHFLWPEHRGQYGKYLFGKAISAADVEATIESFFPNTLPVLFSSARAGLSSILQLLKVVRPDIVWCPPYSSHCVLESIARFGTPSTTDSFHAKVVLVYHQWGVVHRHALPPGAIIIEDAVDAFFLPGANPFAIDGRFTLWSLPKVLGTTWGGVVFCRNNEDAHVLRSIRAERSVLQNIQAVLRMASAYSSMAATYWHGNESMNGGLPSFSLRQIQEHLTDIPLLAQKRSRILDVIQSKGIYIRRENGVLPSNIPLKLSSETVKWFGSQCVFSAGLRSMNLACDYSKDAWSKVAPLPVNQNISEALLYSLPLDKFEGALNE